MARDAVVRVFGRGNGFDPDSLMKFVVAARLDGMAEQTFDRESRRWISAPPGQTYKREAMERKLGYAQKRLSKMLGPKGEISRRADVVEFEMRLLTFAMKERGAGSEVLKQAGWLASFWDELGERHSWLTATLHRTLQKQAVKHLELPSLAGLARWHADLCEAGPHNSAEALILGETLLALFASSTDPVSLWDHYTPQIDRTMRALVSVATRPPGGGATPAIQLAAQFGSPVLPIVEEHLLHSGVGFRAMRIVTRVLRLARTGPPPWWFESGSEVRAATDLIERHSTRTDVPDPYPARSFFVEAVREAILASGELKLGWTEMGTALLRERLHDPKRPFRERLYASLTLREVGASATLEIPSDDAPEWSFMQELVALAGGRTIEEFLLGVANEDPDSRLWFHRPVQGLPVAMGIVRRHLPETDDSPRGGPGTGSPWAAVPSSVGQSTAALVAYALLSPHGTNRRRACEALRDAGLGGPCAEAVMGVLADPDCPDWLQEVSAFVIGYLEDDAVVDALAGIAADRDRAVPVRHAALFALGDLRSRRPAAVDVALEACRDESVEVRRAAAYALATLRPERLGFLGELNTEHRYAEQLAVLHSLATQRAEDPTVARVAFWGIESLRRLAARSDPERRQRTEIWGLQPLQAPQLPAE